MLSQGRACTRGEGHAADPEKPHVGMLLPRVALPPPPPGPGHTKFKVSSRATARVKE